MSLPWMCFFSTHLPKPTQIWMDVYEIQSLECLAIIMKPRKEMTDTLDRLGQLYQRKMIISKQKGWKCVIDEYDTK